MPCFGDSGNTRVAPVNSTLWDRVGTEVARRVEEQVGTTQGEVGRMDIGIPRTRRGGRSQSWEEVVVEEEVKNIRFGPASIHEWHEEAIAKIAQAAWPNTGVGDVGTGHIRPWRSFAHTLARIPR